MIPNYVVTRVPKSMSEAVNDMEAFTQLTDTVCQKILWDPRQELEDAQDILKKIDKRELYKFVGWAMVKQEINEVCQSPFLFSLSLSLIHYQPLYA